MKEVPIAEAWKKKYPEQIVFVISFNQNGPANIMCAGWFTPLSSDPPLLGVSLALKRYSRKLITASKEFVIAFPSAEMQREVHFCGTQSGKSVDKFKETNLTALPAQKIKVPLIKECLANFECKLINEVDVGDHVLLIGEILTAHITEEEKSRLYNFGNLNFKGLSPHPV